MFRLHVYGSIGASGRNGSAMSEWSQSFATQAASTAILAGGAAALGYLSGAQWGPPPVACKRCPCPGLHHIRPGATQESCTNAQPQVSANTRPSDPVSDTRSHPLLADTCGCNPAPAVDAVGGFARMLEFTSCGACCRDDVNARQRARTRAHRHSFARARARVHPSFPLSSGVSVYSSV